jgi:AbrB family looped-hinge helix DNA binding protein
MTVTLKPKTEITVPRSIRRKAGIKPGDQVEFSVSGRVIDITPKPSPDELQDERKIRDPKIRKHIRKSNADYLTGRSRPAQDFLSDLRAEAHKPRKTRPRSASAPPPTMNGWHGSSAGASRSSRPGSHDIKKLTNAPRGEGQYVSLSAVSASATTSTIGMSSFNTVVSAGRTRIEPAPDRVMLGHPDSRTW